MLEKNHPLRYTHFMKTIAPYITIDPKTHFGQPVLKGTRVPVAVVLGKLAAGMNVKELCAEYDLTGVQIRAALRYAAQTIGNERVAYVA